MAETADSVESLIDVASAAYLRLYGTRASYAAVAPGRVNLIGEHTDYNDGFVLPIALPLVTVAVGGASDDGLCHVTTLATDADQPRSVVFQLSSEQHALVAGQPLWANYIKGVAALFPGGAVPFRAVLHSSVPLGAGLSSSAAVEVAMCTLLEYITGNHISSAREKAMICQKAEHQFAGVPCGIMDQTISVCGRSGSAMLLDCRSLETTAVPLSDDSTICVLIANSHVRHQLTGSEYPQRRSDCHLVAEKLNVKALRDASMDMLSNVSSGVLTDQQLKRARHVITENERTQQAARALTSRDYVTVGRLMLQSHESLRDDYNVSCAELDSLVRSACSVDGVLGSRMTGAGFGGCTVTLLYRDAVSACMERVRGDYGRKVTFYLCSPSDGARAMKLEIVD